MPGAGAGGSSSGKTGASGLSGISFGADGPAGSSSGTGGAGVLTGCSSGTGGADDLPGSSSGAGTTDGSGAAAGLPEWTAQAAGNMAVPPGPTARLVPPAASPARMPDPGSFPPGSSAPRPGRSPPRSPHHAGHGHHRFPLRSGPGFPAVFISWAGSIFTVSPFPWSPGGSRQRLRLHGILPDRRIGTPGILYVMDGQPIICIQSPAFSLHIFRIHHSPELSGSAADKDVSQGKPPSRPWTEETRRWRCFPYTPSLPFEVQTALPIPGLQLYKAYILSLFLFLHIHKYRKSICDSQTYFHPLLYSI